MVIINNPSFHRNVVIIHSFCHILQQLSQDHRVTILHMMERVLKEMVDQVDDDIAGDDTPDFLKVRNL